MAKIKNRRLRLMMKLFQREAGKCFYCETDVDIENRRLIREKVAENIRAKIATVDHIVLDSHGGALTMDNTVCACYRCNHKRGNRPAEEFLMEMLAA